MEKTMTRKGTKINYNNGSINRTFISNGLSNRVYCENVLNLIDENGNNTSIIYKFSNGQYNEFLTKGDNMEKTMTYEIGQHLYSTEVCKCESCSKEIPIDSEIVVTSYGGFANPVYGFTCIKCVDRSNHLAGF